MGGRSSFPRRDDDGRVAVIVDLLAMCAAGIVLSLAVLALIDGAFALAGDDGFGRASGWLAAVLPILVLAEDFRAWRESRARWVVAAVGVAVALPLGLLAAGLARGLPSMFSGAIGAAVAVLAYAALWFYGVRRLV